MVFPGKNLAKACFQIVRLVWNQRAHTKFDYHSMGIEEDGLGDPGYAKTASNSLIAIPASTKIITPLDPS